MRKRSQPVRMCVACRKRSPQDTLIRLKQVGSSVIPYDGFGRSFYVCDTCVADEKRLKGLSKRFKQEYESFAKLLKELSDNG